MIPVVVLALAGAVSLPVLTQHPLEDKIWLTGESRFATRQELAQQITPSPRLLLGETHDNPRHHDLQGWAIAQVAAAGRRPVIAMEMIDPDQGPALTAFLSQPTRDPAKLGPAIGWDKSGWPDWRTYQPIAQAALTAGLDMVPANLTKSQMQAAMQAPPPDMTHPHTAALADDIRQGHCGLLPDRAIPAMVNAQQARDQAMADALAPHAQAVLIAGTGHVRHDRGVPAHMQSGEDVFVLAFVEVTGGQDNPQDYAAQFDADTLPFDAVWFTRRQARPDPCQAFKAQMDKKPKP